MEAISWLGCFQDKHEKLRPYMALIHRRKIDLYLLKEHLCRGPFDGQICQCSMTYFHTYMLHDHSPKHIYSGMEVGLEQLVTKIPTYLLEGILTGTVYQY